MGQLEQPENVVFWGAGATASLGIRTTADQTKFLSVVTGSHGDENKPLEDRVAEALGMNDTARWRFALIQLITILGDRDENHDCIDFIHDDQFSAMRQNWRADASDDELKSRIIHLRLIYDWPALKSLVSICPGSSNGKFELNDLFNLLDLLIAPGFGVRAPARRDGFEKSGRTEQFFDARRLIGARNALKLILHALFYVDYQECIRSKRSTLDQYCGFAKALGRRMQLQGIGLAQNHLLEQPEFYRGDVGFVSLNYDPVGLWVQFIANRELNNSAAVPHVGSPAVPLQIFNDSGYMIPSRRIGRKEADWPWYWMDEAVTQRLNEQTVSDARVRLTKLLFPHGCLCWRECPDCRKLSAYYGDQWELGAPALTPPPPLRAFDSEPLPDWINGEERDQREIGAVDARACLHCGTLTYAENTQTVMQSTFKSAPPSFIEEIQRDLRAMTMRAKHIIFLGYSLPRDDVAYRAFFSASRQRRGATVRCTIVDKDNDKPMWKGPAEIKARSFPRDHVVSAASDIFGADNVRYYNGGAPDVFLDGGVATDAKLEQLLTWSSTV